jgi:hypothetical protein
MVEVLAIGWDGSNRCRKAHIYALESDEFSLLSDDNFCVVLIHERDHVHARMLARTKIRACASVLETLVDVGLNRDRNMERKAQASSGTDIAASTSDRYCSTPSSHCHPALASDISCVLSTSRGTIQILDKQNLPPAMPSDDGNSFTKHTVQWPYNGPIRKIACGNDFCLALGDYICCGYGGNRFGQVGIGRYSPLEPTFQRCVLPDGVSVQDIATGSTHAAILSTSGQLYTFGNGAYYKLGLGDDEHRSVPTLVSALEEVGTFRMDGSMSGVKLVACGAFHTIAVSDGTDDVYGWGWNKFGNLGRNPAQHTGADPANMRSAPESTAAPRHSNVVDEHREEIVALPRRIEELDDAYLLGDAAGQEAEALGRGVVKVTCGGRHTALLTQGGRVIVM